MPLRQGRKYGLALLALGALGCAGAGGASKLELPSENSGHTVGEVSALARVIKSGMRTAMLAGDGLTVRDFVHDLKQSNGSIQVELWSADGEQVYAQPAPPPARASLPPSVRDVLATGKPSRPAAGGATSFALLNEEACKTCHPSGQLRAVMTLAITDQPKELPPADALIPFGRVVEAAFDAMMTLGKAHETDVFMNALPKEIPGVKTAAIFSRDGKPSLGDGFMEVPAEVAKRAVSPGPPFATELPDQTTLVTVPLPNAPRCLSCHKPSEMRGAIVLHLDRKLVRDEAAKLLITSSLKHVMLTGLGRLTKRFLGAAARSGLYSTLTVHDAEGRVFHDIAHKPSPPREIAEALRTGKSAVMQRRAGGDFSVIMPVNNDDKCRRCHDEPGNVRAVIAVTSSSFRGAQMANLPARRFFAAKALSR